MSTPNKGRVRVYESNELARDMFETFTARSVEREVEFPFDWPSAWQHVGDSLAIAYSSDKWDQDFTLYKHLAESRNRAYTVPGFLRDYDNPKEPWPTIGPRISLTDIPMPKHFSMLALFEEIDLRLHTRGNHDRPRFAVDEDDGVVKVTIRHGLLGGGHIMWDEAPEPFLFVYTETDGPLILVTGEELAVESDGITG